MNIHFESALLIAIAPAIITSLIDGFGEWSNSRNFQKAKALEAIRSFRVHVEARINNPSSDYYENLENMDNSQMQKLVMFINEWSVYITSDIASRKIIIQALYYELFICVCTLLPVVHQLRQKRDIKNYFKLINQLKMI